MFWDYLTFRCPLVERVICICYLSVPHPHTASVKEVWICPFSKAAFSWSCFALDQLNWKQKVCWQRPAMFCLYTWSQNSKRVNKNSKFDSWYLPRLHLFQPSLAFRGLFWQGAYHRLQPPHQMIQSKKLLIEEFEWVQRNFNFCQRKYFKVFWPWRIVIHQFCWLKVS